MKSFNSRALAFFSLLASILFVTACASGPSPGPVPPASASTMAVEDYRIGVDDIVQVSVWRREDLGVTVPVRSDGKITVPLIGDIRAGGLKPDEVAENATSLLADYIRDPHVTVIVTELNSHEYLSRIRVTGAVRTPISLPHRQGMTVLDAVLAAGGPNEFAAANRSSLHRHLDNGSIKSYKLPLDRILEQGDLTANHVLMPGDVITVPQRHF